MKISQIYHEKPLTLNGIQKKFLLLFISLLLFGLSTQVRAINYADSGSTGAYYSNNGNAYIFVDNGIEFSVFRDGQFDFNIIGNNSNLSVSLNTPNANISFNTGYNYNNYVQYDEYGAIVQIQNSPVYYDDYGRVIQAGNVNVYYNNSGYVSRVGGLYVNYNNYNSFTYTTGYINIYNRAYVYRPWHSYYCAPPYRYAVVYNRPYRRYYYPVRYDYCRPFYNNYRPRTAIGGRHGNTVHKNSSYATANRSKRNITTVNLKNNSRRAVAQNKGRQKHDTKSRNNTQTKRQYTSMSGNESLKTNDHGRRSNNSFNRTSANKSASLNKTNNTEFNRNLKASNSKYQKNITKSAFVTNAQLDYSKRRKRTVNSINEGAARSNNVISYQKSRLIQKPNSSKSRTYNRNTQITKRTTSKPTITRQNRASTVKQTSKRNVSQNKSSSKNNTKSSSRRRV